MQIAVIDADNCVGQPSFDLVERHRRAVLGVPVALGAHVREGGPRQEMDLAHHRADQPFDVATVVRRPHRPIVDTDTVLFAAPLQSLGETVQNLGGLPAISLGGPTGRSTEKAG